MEYKVLRTVYNVFLDVMILLGDAVTNTLAALTDFVVFKHKIRHYAPYKSYPRFAPKI